MRIVSGDGVLLDWWLWVWGITWIVGLSLLAHFTSFWRGIWMLPTIAGWGLGFWLATVVYVRLVRRFF